MSSGYLLTEVGFRYGKFSALNGINLHLPPGKFYGIVGPNGCGKTTLLDLLVGWKQPTSGEVTLTGQPLARYGQRQLARQVALVPQDFAIAFAFTVEEVVLMGRHPYIGRFSSPSVRDWQLVKAAMTAIGIEQFRHRYVNELSGGEKQRVVVARALAQDAEILLCDEATSNLDVQYTHEIFNVARNLVREQGRTVLAVIHNLNLAAAYCDELIFMQQGRIACHGPVAKVLSSGNIKDVFGVEAQVKQDSFSQTPQVSYRYY